MLLIIVKQNNKNGAKSSLQIKQKRDIPNATKLLHKFKYINLEALTKKQHSYNLDLFQGRF